LINYEIASYSWNLEVETKPPGVGFNWRLRFLYNPATTPFMPPSRWVTVPWNGWNEQDLRTAGSRLFLPTVHKKLIDPWRHGLPRVDWSKKEICGQSWFYKPRRCDPWASGSTNNTKVPPVMALAF